MVEKLRYMKKTGKSLVLWAVVQHKAVMQQNRTESKQ